MFNQLQPNDFRTATNPTRHRERLERGDVITNRYRTSDGARAVEVEVLVAAPPSRVHRLMTTYERLPEAIVGLDRADVVWRVGGVAQVDFAMKLPFPIGRLHWTNRIAWRSNDSVHEIAWEYVDGDLGDNTGELILEPWGDITRAVYRVRIATHGPIPGAAERLALRWLLPKVVSRLREAIERTA